MPPVTFDYELIDQLSRDLSPDSLFPANDRYDAEARALLTDQDGKRLSTDSIVKKISGWLITGSPEQKMRGAQLAEDLNALLSSLSYITDPDKSMGQTRDERKENQKNLLWQFNATGINDLPDLLTKYNKVNNYNSAGTPEMQAISALISGLTKVKIDLQQRTAYETWSAFEDSAEKCLRQSNRFPAAKMRLETQRVTFDGIVDLAGLDDDIKEFSEDLKKNDQELKQHQSTLDTLKKQLAPEVLQKENRNILLQDFYIKSLERSECRDALFTETYGPSRIRSEAAALLNNDELTALLRAEDNVQKKQPDAENQLQSLLTVYSRKNEALKNYCDKNGREKFLNELADIHKNLRKDMDVKKVTALNESLKKAKAAEAKAAEALFGNGPEQKTAVERAQKTLREKGFTLNQCRNSLNKSRSVLSSISNEASLIEGLQKKSEYLAAHLKTLNACQESLSNIKTELTDVKTFNAGKSYNTLSPKAEKLCGDNRLTDIMSRLESMYKVIDDAKEPSHDNSTEFKEMRRCLKEFLEKDPSGKRSLNTTVKYSQKDFEDLKHAAEHYLSEKKKGIFHHSGNAMRNYRMQFARELISLTSEAQHNYPLADTEAKNMRNFNLSVNTNSITDQEKYQTFMKENFYSPEDTIRGAVNFQVKMREDLAKMNKTIENARSGLAVQHPQAPHAEEVKPALNMPV